MYKSSYKIGAEVHHVHCGSCIIRNIYEKEMILFVEVKSTGIMMPAHMGKFHSNY